MGSHHLFQHGAHEGYEGDEGREEHDERRDCRGARRGVWPQEVSVHEGHEHPCDSGREGGEERWKVRDSGRLHGQDKKKAATKAGKKIMFGKEVTVKAKPAKTVVKAFPVAAIK